MLNVNELLDIARNTQCSDLHFTLGLPPIVRQHGVLKRLEDFEVCTDALLEDLVNQLCTPKQIAEMAGDGFFTIKHRAGEYMLLDKLEGKKTTV